MESDSKEETSQAHILCRRCGHSLSSHEWDEKLQIRTRCCLTVYGTPSLRPRPGGPVFDASIVRAAGLGPTYPPCPCQLFADEKTRVSPISDSDIDNLIISKGDCAAVDELFKKRYRKAVKSGNLQEQKRILLQYHTERDPCAPDPAWFTKQLNIVGLLANQNHIATSHSNSIFRDKRKREVAALISKNPQIETFDICKEMDRKAEGDTELEALPSWGGRIWVIAYRVPRSAKHIRTYVSKIRQALATRSH